jgi:hypothetical protein
MMNVNGKDLRAKALFVFNGRAQVAMLEKQFTAEDTAVYVWKDDEGNDMEISSPTYDGAIANMVFSYPDQTVQIRALR